MIDATDFREDPLYMPKDTKVFVIYDANSLDDTISRDRTIDMFGKYGYQCSNQRLLSVDTINNSYEELGFDGIQVDSSHLSVLEVRQWYTFINVLRKARVLQKHFIVSFTGSEVFGDFPIGILERAITIHPRGTVCIMSTTEANRIVKQVLSLNKLTNSVKQYLRNRADSILNNTVDPS